MATLSQHPYHPIIYVRCFVATQSEIENTVADPYMGFNTGSTKALSTVYKLFTYATRR